MSDCGCRTDSEHLPKGDTTIAQGDPSHMYEFCATLLGETVCRCKREDGQCQSHSAAPVPPRSGCRQETQRGIPGSWQASAIASGAGV